MSRPPAGEVVDGVLDLRELPKVERHPAVFTAYDELAVGESLVLVNEHDPVNLRDQLERDYGTGFGWEYLSEEVPEYRIRLTKNASTPLPRVLADTTEIASGAGERGLGGAVFSLRMRERDLDSNVIALEPGGAIAEHWGPDVDVLVHVLAGSGHLDTETGVVDLAPGVLLWLPRRSRRAFRAGPQGLRYLTVHRRREALVLQASRPPGAP